MAVAFVVRPASVRCCGCGAPMLWTELLLPDVRLWCSRPQCTVVAEKLRDGSWSIARAGRC